MARAHVLVALATGRSPMGGLGSKGLKRPWYPTEGQGTYHPGQRSTNIRRVKSAPSSAGLVPEPYPHRSRYQQHVRHGRGNHDPIDVAHGRSVALAWVAFQANENIFSET